MPAPIIFKSQRELESFIARVVTPLAEKIADKKVKEAMAFRSKKETSSATSSYQIGTRNPTGQSGGNIGAAGIVSGSRSASALGVPIPALTSLLRTLDSIGFIKNQTTT